ncbi:MAG TPA: hypothetical protein VMY37_09780 [Thermoguttaceae bacterium]|nr:hypothetical protein [Thermoguttaceae bacterium]
MRRHPVLLLALMAVSLWAARGFADEAARPLRIATFQADVTPPLGAPLCHGNVRPAERIVDPLSARGIILLADGPPIVLCAVDWVGIGNAAHDAFRRELAEAVGTSPDRVCVHVAHQHDTPGIDFSTEELLAAHGLGGKMFDVAVAHEAIGRVAQAAGEAARKPQPVTHVGCGTAKVDQVASSRRVLGPDGKVQYVRFSSCRNEKAIEAPEGTIDPYLRVLSFWDGDRPLVAINYYACHPQSYYGQGGVSYDFVGMARGAREAALPGVFQVYFNGAGGNVGCGKYNNGAKENRPVLAKRLEAGMKAAWEATEKTPVTAADVSWRVCPVGLPVSPRISEEGARRTLEDAKVSVRERMHAARDLVFLRRMQSGHKIPLACLEIGPASVVHMPGELFVEYQLAAQAMRPDRSVFMAAYGDAGPTYIGTKIAYSQGGYEPTRSRVAPEVEAVLLAALRELLAAEKKGTKEGD